MQDFYMVYVRGGGAPAVRHASREEADAEAVRLAALLCRDAYVLQSIQEVKAPEGSVPTPPPGPKVQYKPKRKIIKPVDNG